MRGRPGTGSSAQTRLFFDWQPNLGLQFAIRMHHRHRKDQQQRLVNYLCKRGRFTFTFLHAPVGRQHVVALLQRPKRLRRDLQGPTVSVSNPATHHRTSDSSTNPATYPASPDATIRQRDRYACPQGQLRLHVRFARMGCGAGLCGKLLKQALDIRFCQLALLWKADCGEGVVQRIWGPCSHLSLLPGNQDQRDMSRSNRRPGCSDRRGVECVFQFLVITLQDVQAAGVYPGHRVALSQQGVDALGRNSGDYVHTPHCGRAGAPRTLRRCAYCGSPPKRGALTYRGPVNTVCKW